MLPYRQSTNKYGNKWTPCGQFGLKCKGKHQSKGEAAYCNQLSLLERAGKLTYTTQVRYALVVKNFVICYHILDFEVDWKDGRGREVHDVKGAQTADWKLKYKLFRALYPKIPYILIHRNKIMTAGLPTMKKEK